MLQEINKFMNSLPAELKQAGLKPKEGLHVLLKIQEKEGTHFMDEQSVCRVCLTRKATEFDYPFLQHCAELAQVGLSLIHISLLTKIRGELFDYSLEHPFRDYRIQQTNDHIKMKNMKTRLILFILLFISGFAIAGCKQQNQYRPDAKIVAAFNNKYPQADKVEWEQKQGYYVAEFREDGIEHEAWFDGTGKRCV